MLVKWAPKVNWENAVQKDLFMATYNTFQVTAF